MLALRLEGHMRIAQQLRSALVPLCNVPAEQVIVLESLEDAPACKLQHIVTTPLTHEEKETIRQVWAVQSGSSVRWTVLSFSPSCEEAVQQLSSGADRYLTFQPNLDRLAARLLDLASGATRQTLDRKRLMRILALFDQPFADESPDWRHYLSRLAIALDVERIGVVLPGGAILGTFDRDEGGEGEGGPEVLAVPLQQGADGRGYVVIERTRSRGMPIEEDWPAAAVSGRLLVERVQHNDLLVKILTAKRDWEATADAIRDPIVMLDGDGNAIRANRAFAELVGSTVQEVVGEAVDAQCGMKSDGWRAITELSPQQSAAPRLALPICPERWFEVHTARLGGHLEKSILYLRDVTDERRLTSLLVQRERFSALGELASGVFHDLNNLASALQPELACARMALPSLLDALPTLDNDNLNDQALRKDLELISTSIGSAVAATRRLEQVLSNLRQYSRLREDAEANRGTTNRIAINKLIQALPVLFNARARKQGVRFELELESHLPVRGNASELMRVFENLIENALVSMQHGGTIRISTASIDGRVRVNVSDTGHGIPSDIVPRVFDRGFTTRQKSGGTGLGLFIVRQVITAHGGSISVAKNGSGGTTFSVELREALE